MTRRVLLDAKQREAIVAHARATYPEECCGFLVGTREDGTLRVVELAPATNAREDSPANRYSIPPEEFAVVQREIEAIRHRTRVIIVDFHAEATSEKIAMGWFLDGKVSAVFGTHTHVQTADERILPNGTAYLTDAGMTGPHDGIIGMDREGSLARFLTAMPSKFEAATANPRLNGVVVETDDKTGRSSHPIRSECAYGTPPGKRHDMIFDDMTAKNVCRSHASCIHPCQSSAFIHDAFPGWMSTTNNNRGSHLAVN